MADDTPTPPPNPFESSGADIDMNGANGGSGDGLAAGAPGVAAKPGKAMLVVGIVGALVLILLYSIIFGGKGEKEAPKKDKVPVPQTQIEPPPLPTVDPTLQPVAPPITVPSLPQPIELPQPKLNLNPLTPEQDAAAKQQALARMKSKILIAGEDGGSGGGISNPFSSSSSATSSDPNAAFEAQASNAKVETVKATKLRNLSRTIAQGRVIHATMETALNTDLSAPIRAIVSRDTYGEAGTEPLVPKGSRIIGRYNTAVSNGQSRVFVVWTRLLRPDGVDVALGSPLVDGIGQAGVAGQVDSKFQEIFSRALLSSVINIAMAIGSDSLSGDTETTTTTGSTTTSGGAATEATTNALNRLGSVTDGFIQRFLNVPPTILVDQGTVVNVMVNRDIVFPAEVTDPEVVQ